MIHLISFFAAAVLSKVVHSTTAPPGHQSNQSGIPWAEACILHCQRSSLSGKKTKECKRLHIFVTAYLFALKPSIHCTLYANDRETHFLTLVDRWQSPENMKDLFFAKLPTMYVVLAKPPNCFLTSSSLKIVWLWCRMKYKSEWLSEASGHLNK